MKILEIKLECRRSDPYGLMNNEIRRKYCVFGMCMFKTNWFKLSKLWPGLTATISELKTLDITEIVNNNNK